MSINWVMLSEPGGAQPFIHLPSERTTFQTSARTSLNLTTPSSSSHYPASAAASGGHVNISSSDGTLYLTNQRIVYIPKTSNSTLKSFSAPLLNLHDSHVVVPWFGPNSWMALVQPVAGGNLADTHLPIELKFTFKDGGVSEFHTLFERLKERLQQVVETAREANGIDGRLSRRDGGMPGVDLSQVHLDELPTYQASGSDRIAPDHLGAGPALSRDDVTHVTGGGSETTSGVPVATVTNTSSVQPPSDAPPGYEETQQQSVQEELERMALHDDKMERR